MSSLMGGWVCLLYLTPYWSLHQLTSIGVFQSKSCQCLVCFICHWLAFYRATVPITYTPRYTAVRIQQQHWQFLFGMNYTYCFTILNTKVVQPVCFDFMMSEESLKLGKWNLVWLKIINTSSNFVSNFILYWIHQFSTSQTFRFMFP